MNEKQLTVERLRAKANWQLLKLQQRAGDATEQQVQEARLVWERIGQYTPAAPEPSPAAPPTDLPTTPELAALLAELEKERSAVDVQKRQVSNRLQQIPAGVPCPELTTQILDLRQQWEELGDKVVYVKRYGHLPTEAVEVEESFPVDYAENLPRDKFELDKLLKNMAINVNHRWPKRMATAKTVAKKAEYEKKIAIGLAQMEVMKELFMTL